MTATLTEGDKRGNVFSNLPSSKSVRFMSGHFLQVSLINHFTVFVIPCIATGEQDTKKYGYETTDVVNKEIELG